MKAKSDIPSPVFIDDVEPTPAERVGDWLAMLAALWLVIPIVLVAGTAVMVVDRLRAK